MQKIQNYTKAAAAFIIFFFCYDLTHRTDRVQVIAPGDTVVIGGNTVTHTTPTGSHGTYVPPEGSTTIVTSTKPVTVGGHAVNGSSTTPAVIMIINDRGKCKVPGIGIVYSGRALLNVDIKLAYYKRYSATVGINNEFLNAGVYRHIDDLIGLKNLEVGVVIGLGFDGQMRYGAAARLNL